MGKLLGLRLALPRENGCPVVVRWRRACVGRFCYWNGNSCGRSTGIRQTRKEEKRDFSLRRPTHSSRRTFRDAKPANDSGGIQGFEGRPDVWSGLPVNWGKWRRLPCGDGYLVELEVAEAAWALALASSGTTPSCCIMPKASQLT